MGIFISKQWNDSRQTCETAAVLIRQAKEVITLSEESAKDPFIELHANPALIDPALDEYRNSVRKLLAKRWSFHLKQPDLENFRKLQENKKDLSFSFLKSIAAQEAPRECPLTKSNLRMPASDPSLSLKNWVAENQSQIQQSRSEFLSDQETYCRTERAHFKIFLAKHTIEERCSKGTKCRKDQLENISKELAEINERLQLNRNKMKSKWGEKISGRVLCTSQ